MPDTPDPRLVSRRGFVLAVSAAAAGLTGWAPGAALAHSRPERRLVIHHQHTGEWLRTAYFAEGRYREEGLLEINRILRDWRTGEVRVIDPRLLDIVYLLQQRLALAGPLEVVCGYRSPSTNAMLRRKSRGVARNSLHMDGKAIDIGFKGATLAAMHRAAVELGAGGVGYYPASGFIHLDSGPPRAWGQPAGQGSRRARARAARLRAGRKTRAS
jgi:uncharacterized protein YcbK (DUF882 family)